MSDDVIRRYNGARPIQAPAQLLADAIHEIEVLRKENARLREAVKAAYYEGWQDRESIIATGERLDFDWNCSEARYAIREGGKDD